ncbi:glutaredoxin family protein [Macrococcus hajekii]|uniref:Glutaredoxin family protein n=1 Tax=Macrococcus hajekii TaxID=198482 RepID=A0A4R6BNB7_9STAP|nr:glutaredoxin family protein [Macrococcus hajekii]TDM03336.1 glutaredoxin family protein [Macrococcus hajekii]GGA97993.1 NrdH-redoxin [Macrococcus hajekii]
MHITVYTQDQCPPCEYIKNYFTEHQIPFTEKNISNSAYRAEMIEKDAFSTPFIIIDGEELHTVDMDRIEALIHV